VPYFVILSNYYLKKFLSYIILWLRFAPDI